MRKLINRLSREERGFTLIELLVVIAIIGILLGIAAPKVLNSLGKARDTKAKSNIAMIQAALEQFKEEYGQYPVQLQQLKFKGFVKTTFDFKNAYGHFYFYAVGDTPGQNGKWRKYVLADPGKDAAAWSGDAPATLPATPPEGVDPATGTFYWGAATEAATYNLVQDIDYNHDGTIQTATERVTIAGADANLWGSARPTWGTTFEGTSVTED